MSLLFYPRKSHWHLHRGLRQCSWGKDTKSLWNKQQLNKKNCKKDLNYLDISTRISTFAAKIICHGLKRENGRAL